jgi:hypothetical protein
MAVPARVERLRGAQAASELARAGTIEVRASDGLSCDRLTFGHQPHPQRASLYTSCQNCQRFFVTNTTKMRNIPYRSLSRQDAFQRSSSDEPMWLKNPT